MVCTWMADRQHMATAISLDMNLPLTVMFIASAPYIDVICIVCDLQSFSSVQFKA
jgi:hypothetical protein